MRVNGVQEKVRGADERMERVRESGTGGRMREERGGYRDREG